MGADDDFYPMGGAHPHSPASALLGCLASLFHRFRPENDEENELQPPVLSGLHLHVLFARLLPLFHRSSFGNQALNELQQPSTPSRLDLRTDAIIDILSSLFRSTSTKKSDSRNAQYILMLSKWPRCGTGRCKACISTTRPIVGSSRAFSLLRVSSTR
ncbi:hypothetical protein BDR07DRAFT_1411705 [Suillus spraguei]|nr:hypothetical protein BDR07DRAFT_1411705 [Suillus spraguei]